MPPRNFPVFSGMHCKCVAMKQILFLVFTAAILSVSAQTEGELIDARPVRVMIVPYHPNYYLSDADQELAEINEKKPDELSRIFRYGLDFSMQVQVQQQFEAYSFLRDTAEVADAELRSMYSGITYKYQKPFDLLSDDKVEERKDTHDGDIFGIHQTNEEEKEKRKRWGQPDEDEVELPKEYMNAVVKDPTVLADISGRYGVDYFIFLNQFELKTNYETCLDRASHNFQREVLVHYSIYDRHGNQLKGSVVSVLFGSNDNRLDLIIGEYLPQITAGIQRELLGQVLKDND